MLLGVDSIVHGVPVVGINDLSLLLVHDIQLLVDEELQKIYNPLERVHPSKVLSYDRGRCQSMSIIRWGTRSCGYM